MNNNEDFVYRAFLQLRQQGLYLGMQELMDAVRLADIYDTREEMKPLLLLLWCDSIADYIHFDDVWKSVNVEIPEVITPEPAPEPPEPDPAATMEPPEEPAPPDDDEPALPPQEDPAPPPTPRPQASAQDQISAMPFRVSHQPVEGTDMIQLDQYYPISRRFMNYIWRYLRRDIADGARDLVDIRATIDLTARMGFFFEPVLRRRTLNHAHLVLLLDHGGSMMPFHHYLRDLVETARDESDIERVDIYYFNNVPIDKVFRQPKRAEPVPFAEVLQTLDEFTSVLIVSDAGAARKHNDIGRVMETELFLESLRARTQLFAWLNPMPQDRWEDSSAEEIHDLMRGDMFQMDEDGMSNAIDVLRGLRVH